MFRALLVLLASVVGAQAQGSYYCEVEAEGDRKPERALCTLSAKGRISGYTREGNFGQVCFNTSMDANTCDQCDSVAAMMKTPHCSVTHWCKACESKAWYVDDCTECSEYADEMQNYAGCKDVSWTCKCFPGDAAVMLEDGTSKTMAEIAIGDKVLVGKGVYSEVYMFSHRFEDAEATFVALTTAAGATLALTGGHYLYANGALVEARRVRPGDNVTLADGRRVPVRAVGAVRKAGIYNPHTLHGDIVVNGVLTSTYTAAFAPTLAHVALAPLRALYRAGVDIFRVDLGAALDELPAWWTDLFSSSN